VQDSTVAAAIGAVVELQEHEYEYGLGPLRLRIERIDVLRIERGWAVVRGVQIDHRGHDVRTREVTVPIAALIRALPTSEDE
jgi:hypothetical protein